MKLGVVTTSYPRHPGDFAGHFVARHVEELAAAGHRVSVIAAGDAASPRHERRGSVELTRLPSDLFFTGGAPESLAARGLVSALPTAARWLVATSRRAPAWRAACAHWLVPSALAALATPGPLLAIAHGGDVHALRRARLLVPALASLLARRARLAFVSDELRALARAALPAPLHRRFDAAAIVQPMGVDCARLAAASRTPRPHPRPYALVLGRLVAIKGVELALDTVDACAALAPDRALDLVVIGDGPERAALEAQARALRSSRAWVHFLGALPTHACAPWLAHAAAVLLPSRVLPDGRAEGTPQVALEALAAGVPLLASATGGLAALPPPVRLLGDRAPSRWAAALAELLRHPPAPAELRALARPRDWPLVAAALWDHWMS